jgi:uncharacterized protein YbjT (DUF2867 family)
MTQTILVVGATGMLGEPVARQLQKDGYQVRALTRNRHLAQTKLGDSFEIVEGDVENPSSVERALDGCFGVHLNLGGGERTVHLGAMHVALLAARLGVERVTFLSDVFISSKTFSLPHLRAKLMAEEAIRESGAPYSIFRLCPLMEAVSQMASTRQKHTLPKTTLAYHWVAARDYARMVSKAYQLPEAANKRFFIFGPEPLTLVEAFERFRELVNPDLKIEPVANGLLSLKAKLSLDSNFKHLVKTMELQKKFGAFGDPAETNSLLGAPTTTFDEWCREQRR